MKKKKDECPYCKTKTYGYALCDWCSLLTNMIIRRPDIADAINYDIQRMLSLRAKGE